MTVFFFLLETSLGKMSSFVSPIPRDRFGERCRNPPQYRDRPKCNSHLLGSSSLSPRLILSLNVLTDISCLLNCYLVEISTSSLYYSLSLLFEFPSLDRCSCLVLSPDLSIRFPLVYSHSFLMIFFF